MINGLQDITIGRYFPCDSPVHKLDSRLKFLLVVSLMIAAGIFETGYSFFLIGVLSLLLGMLSRIPLVVLTRGLRPFIFLFTITFIFHSFLTPGRPLSFPLLDSSGITYEGVLRGLIINLRLVLLIVLSSLFTLTTSPQNIVYAIEWYLKPLNLIGLPVKKISVVLLISLKFIPIFFHEISKATSSSREGHSKKSKQTFYSKIKETVSLISPVVINSFRRANRLAREIDSNGYSAIEKL